MTDPVPRKTPASVLLIALAVYGIEAVWAHATYRDWINPDAICYARNALYWTQGRYADAVSGYWSPLLSLCVAPFVAAGFDALHAAAAVVAVWGGLLVFATWLLIRRLGILPTWLALAALVLTAEATVRWGATIFPDVILAASLMLAAAVFADAGVVERRGVQLAAGALGGVAYLGKAYGLPFFLVAAPISLAVLHGPWLSEDAAAGRRDAWKRLGRAWAWTMVGFVLVAGPWVVALSIKFQTPTIGLVAKINRAVIGPREAERTELWTPVPGRVTGWEIPETRRYGYWSPLESVSSFRWQVRYSWNILKQIRGSLARFDWLSIGLTLTVLSPFLALLLDDRRLLRFAVWNAAVWAVYCGGFAFVYFTFRYTTPFLKPLAVVGALAFAERAGAAIATAARPLRAERWARPALVGLVIVSFAAHANVPFTPYIVEEPGGTPFDDVTVDAGPHRALARRLAEAGASGPIAANAYWGGMFTAYFMDAGFVGSPAGEDWSPIAAELATVGARTFLVDPAWPLAGVIAGDPHWRLLVRENAAGQAIDVYVAR
jgi:hypothetical protein